MVVLLLACYGDLSNAIFEEDAKFYAALPSTDAFALAYPVPAEGLVDDPALFHGVTTETMEGTASFLDTVVGATGVVTAVPPNDRGEDWRVWGPGAWDAYPGSYLRMEMSRTSDESLYTFAFQVADTSAGPWTEFTSGTWRVDPGPGWQGELVFDYSELASVVGGSDEGVVAAGWDAREGRVVDVSVDVRVAEQAHLFQAGVWEDESGGRFEFTGPQSRLVLSTSFVTRWDAEGNGRADGTVYADPDRGEFRFVQCWTAQAESVYYSDDGQPSVQDGDSTLCALEAEGTE